MICPTCNLSYSEYRTGLTFGEVYDMLQGRPWRRRHGVLGYWREIKLREWVEHKRLCVKYLEMIEDPEQPVERCEY